LKLVLFVSLSLLISTCFSTKVALVLGAGGARASFHVGAIQRLCETSDRNSWDFIVASSIGAINGAILAQYNKNEQCEKGLPDLKNFWSTIKEQSDIFESYSWFTIGQCLNSINFISLGKGFYKTGGMCSLGPGTKKFERAVSMTKLVNSNMPFYFVATGFHDSENPVWFDKKTTSNLSKQIIASASLPFLVPPVQVNGRIYMDGGVFTDIPITKALELGATKVQSIILHDLAGVYDGDVFQAEREEKMGPLVLEYIYNVVHRNAFFVSDLRYSCRKYPNIPILGIAPKGSLGEVCDFTSRHISNAMDLGYSQAKTQGFVNLCAAASLIPGRIGKSFEINNEAVSKANGNAVDQSIFVSVGIAVVGALVGGFIVFAVFARRNKVNAQHVFIPVPPQ